MFVEKFRNISNNLIAMNVMIMGLIITCLFAKSSILVDASEVNFNVEAILSDNQRNGGSYYDLDMSPG